MHHIIQYKYDDIFRGNYITKLYFRKGSGKEILYRNDNEIIINFRPKMWTTYIFDNFDTIRDANKFIANITSNFNYFYLQQRK